jgi:hypothetical protein
MAESLAEALQCRPWNRALFTTYSLSLTFFESVILRFLRQSGCREIWVVADAQGYQSSLMERRSHGVGQEYHLIPLALPHGVFHPKCCYLEGPEGDLLAVGSGNLTFGGFGRNLEVMDVLSPESSPDCFREFGSFLNALRGRADVRCPEPIWMDSFADRAFEVAGEYGSSLDRHIWLVHSTLEPVIDQVTRVVAAHGPIQDLTVLSPYHDLDGGAVKELVDQAGAARLQIGLPPAPHLSSFPFPVTEEWQVPTSAVRVNVDGEKRYLHAKWMEWNTEHGLLALTGSVNATSQALLTTNNIEVGVLRFDPTGKGWTEWEHVSTPAQYLIPEYSASGLLSTYVLYAELCGTGEIRGRIISSKSAAGPWGAVLLKPSGEFISFSAEVSAEGTFQVFLTEFEDFAFSPALQLTMTSGAIVARGWVQNTEILSMPRLRKLGISSLLRLINREETADDDIALLDYLAIHASDHLLTFQHAIRRAPHGQPEGQAKDDRFVVHIADLAPIDESQHGSPDATVLGTTTASALERIFSQLRRRLLGNVGPEKETASVSAFEVDAEDPTSEDTGQQEAQEQRRVQGSLDYFDASMRQLVDTDGVEPAKRNSLFVLWLELTLHMLLRRQSDRAAALAFLRNWFQKATGKCRVMEKVDAMEQHLVTAAALLRCVGSTCDAPAPREIHEALETFWAGAVPAERAARSLLTDSRIGLGGLLLDIDSAQLESALSEILATRTLRLEIADVLSSYRQKLPLPASPIFDGQTGLALQSELIKRNGKARVKQLSRNESACPNCFCNCCASVASSLRTSRMAICTSCGWIILRTMP